MAKISMYLLLETLVSNSGWVKTEIKYADFQSRKVEAKQLTHILISPI